MNGYYFVTLEAEILPALALLELKRRNAHADKVGAMDALEALRHHGAHAQEPCSLRRPVARGAGAIFLAGEDDERHALIAISHGGIIDRHLLARRIVPGDAALDARNHLVLDADIGEGAAHHDFVIAAPRAIGVEIDGTHLALGEKNAGG